MTTGTRTATSRDERPVLASVGDDQIFGLMTLPTDSPNGAAVVILPSSGVPSSGRNRIWTRWARRLSPLGYHVMRFDYQGEGESTGQNTHYRLDEPLVDNLLAILEPLRAEQVEGIYLVGMCFGARTALSTAVDVDDIAGVVMLAPPLRDFEAGRRRESRPASWYVRRALSPRAVAILADRRRRRRAAGLVRRKLRGPSPVETGSRPDTTDDGGGRDSRRASPRAVGELERLLGRQVPVLMIFGERDDFYDDYRRALGGPLGPVVKAAGELLTVRVLDGHVHVLTERRLQNEVMDEIEAWLGRVHPREPLATF